MNSRGGQVENAVALEEAAQWCVRLSSAELSRVEHAALQTWLSAAPIHQELLDDAIRAWGAVEEQAAQPDLLEMRSEALADVRHARSALRARRSTISRAAWAVAASAVLAVAAVFGVHQYGGQTYRTANGERRMITLADGSMVSMDAESVLTVRYTDGSRRLDLKGGRAKFSVAHDALRPFSVKTGPMIVVATGTQFSVERLTHDVRVVLYEGRVAIYESGMSSGGVPTPLKAGGSSEAVVLTPGQEMIAGGAGVAPRVIADDPEKSLAWESGQLVFSNETLAVAVERVNRYSKTKLRIGDVAANNVRVSGVFATGNTQAFVDGVTHLFPVSAKSGDDEVTLVSDSQR